MCNLFGKCVYFSGMYVREIKNSRNERVLRINCFKKSDKSSPLFKFVQLSLSAEGCHFAFFVFIAFKHWSLSFFTHDMLSLLLFESIFFQGQDVDSSQTAESSNKDDRQLVRLIVNYLVENYKAAQNPRKLSEGLEDRNNLHLVVKFHGNIEA